MAAAGAVAVEEVQVVSSHGDALFELGGPESDHRAKSIGEYGLGLLFGGSCQWGIGRFLLHHRAGVQFGEVTGDPDRVNQVGALDLTVDRGGRLGPSRAGLDRNLEVAVEASEGRGGRGSGGRRPAG